MFMCSKLLSITPLLLLVLIAVSAEGDENAQDISAQDEVNETSTTTDQTMTNKSDEPITNKPMKEDDKNLEEADVLCSMNHLGSRLWKWLDPGEDVDIKGSWREYAVCRGKSASQGRYRFAAFELRDPSTYSILLGKCREEGYEFAQPAMENPDDGQFVGSFGWPDRDYNGITGPASLQLCSGRPDSVLERQQRLAYQGWFVYHVASSDDFFSAGFLTVESCKNIEAVNDFRLRDIPCDQYKNCV